MASSQLFSFVRADSLQVRTHSHSSGNDQESRGAVSSKAEMGKPNTVPRFDGFWKGFCFFSAEGEVFFLFREQILQQERESSTLNSNVKTVSFAGLCRMFNYFHICKVECRRRSLESSNLLCFGHGPIPALGLLLFLFLLFLILADGFVPGGSAVTLCHLQSHCGLRQEALGKDPSWLHETGNEEI